MKSFLSSILAYATIQAASSTESTSRVDLSLPLPSVTLPVHERKFPLSGEESRRRLSGENRFSAKGLFPMPGFPHSHSSSKVNVPPVPPSFGNAPPPVGKHLGKELTPIYPGYGTHISYVYVGTPAKRQSVIIDTGSHYTAFPCKGCTSCGTHTDPYFDPEQSTTAVVPKCGGVNKCELSQSYSEGSSWKAYKVIDKLWVGGLTPGLIPNASDYVTDFQFACQTEETGLFRTQLADGIMGMSNAEDTLVPQLYRLGITTSKMFALCFRVGGGIMTLGGVDQSIHTNPTDIKYAKLSRRSNWFTLNLLDLLLEDQVTGFQQKVTTNTAIFNIGKGAIVDSGTTDTYLPSMVARQFTTLYASITGINYDTSKPISLTTGQLRKLPNMVFVFEGLGGAPIQVKMSWSSFVENTGAGQYSFRVFLTEASGVVLGANFMLGNNIIFDSVNNRVGFAESTCKYDSFGKIDLALPTLAPTALPLPAEGAKDGSCVSRQSPIAACTAQCNQEADSYVANGSQQFIDTCQGAINKPCSVSCKGLKLVRGDFKCPDTAWLTCSESCKQSHKIGHVTNTGNPAVPSSGCSQTESTRECYSGLCPTAPGDYLIFIDLKVKKISPLDWSYVYTDVFTTALASMLMVPEGSVELLNDASGELTMAVKLHFQIRLTPKMFGDEDKNGISDMFDAAEKIPETVDSPYFPVIFITQLSAASAKLDNLDHNRYGWLKPEDIEVVNSMALPLSADRDPIDVPNEISIDGLKKKFGVFSTGTDLFLLGVALSSLFCSCVVLCFYRRLQQENAALSKDKLSGFSLRELWSRFDKEKRYRGNQKYSRVKSNEREVELESLAPGEDDQLDSADLEDMHS